jgi:hypothetical protein
MTNEWNSAEMGEGVERNLDARLAEYYGPALLEQPLEASSWQVLRSQLGSRRPPRSRMARLWHFRCLTDRGRVPPFVQGAFARITNEARLPFSASTLHCTTRPRLRVPEVRVSLLHRRHIRLSLPSAVEGTIEPAMLDVLLSTGLARYLKMRRPVYALPRLILFTVVPLAGIALALLRLIAIPLLPLLIAIGLFIVVSMLAFWLLDRQRRLMAVSADSLMVQWLGRGRACQGLRALADRSRTPHRRRWGELSLTERIARVCGTQVQLEYERLTLVR